MVLKISKNITMVIDSQRRYIKKNWKAPNGIYTQ